MLASPPLTQHTQAPDPVPMASFKGQPLTHELAEDLFIGWLQVRGPLLHTLLSGSSSNAQLELLLSRG